jgi:hypothetical protein
MTSLHHLLDTAENLRAQLDELIELRRLLSEALLSAPARADWLYEGDLKHPATVRRQFVATVLFERESLENDAE